MIWIFRQAQYERISPVTADHSTGSIDPRRRRRIQYIGYLMGIFRLQNTAAVLVKVMITIWIWPWGQKYLSGCVKHNGIHVSCVLTKDVLHFLQKKMLKIWKGSNIPSWHLVQFYNSDQELLFFARSQGLHARISFKGRYDITKSACSKYIFDSVKKCCTQGG